MCSLLLWWLLLLLDDRLSCLFVLSVTLVYCGQVLRRIKIKLGRPRPRPHCVIWGPSSPSQKGYNTPVFGPCLLWLNGRPFQLLLSSCYYYYRCIAFLPCLFGFFIKRTGRSGERSERIATKTRKNVLFAVIKLNFNTYMSLYVAQSLP